VSKLAALKRLGPIQIIFLLLALIPLTGLPAYQFYILERGMQNGLVVLSLVILLGYTGQLSLGQSGLVAVGAYAYGILCVNYGVSPWVSLAIAPWCLGWSASCWNSLLQIDRSFPGGQHHCLFRDRPHPHSEQREIHGGPFGLNRIPTILGGLPLYYFMLVVAYLASFATLRLSRSHIGLAFKAIREDEVTAEVMGCMSAASSCWPS